MPLLGRGADQRFELDARGPASRRDVLSCRSARLDLDRGAARLPHGVRRLRSTPRWAGSARPCATTSVAGPAGSVVRSPKNSTSTPPVPMSRSQSRHSTSLLLSALIDAIAGPGPSGTTFMPSDRRKPSEPLEQLRRLERLDHDRDRDALVSDPAPRPLPSAQVGKGEDHAPAGGERHRAVVDALVRESSSDVGLRGRSGQRNDSTQ